MNSLNTDPNQPEAMMASMLAQAADQPQPSADNHATQPIERGDDRSPGFSRYRRRLSAVDSSESQAVGLGILANENLAAAAQGMHMLSQPSPPLAAAPDVHGNRIDMSNYAYASYVQPNAPATDPHNLSLSNAVSTTAPAHTSYAIERYAQSYNNPIPSNLHYPNAQPHVSSGPPFDQRQSYYIPNPSAANPTPTYSQPAASSVYDGNDLYIPTPAAPAAEETFTRPNDNQPANSANMPEPYLSNPYIPQAAAPAAEETFATSNPNQPANSANINESYYYGASASAANPTPTYSRPATTGAYKSNDLYIPTPAVPVAEETFARPNASQPANSANMPEPHFSEQYMPQPAAPAAEEYVATSNPNQPANSANMNDSHYYGASHSAANPTPTYSQLAMTAANKFSDLYIPNPAAPPAEETYAMSNAGNVANIPMPIPPPTGIQAPVVLPTDPTPNSQWQYSTNYSPPGSSVSKKDLSAKPTALNLSSQHAQMVQAVKRKGQYQQHAQQQNPPSYAYQNSGQHHNIQNGPMIGWHQPYRPSAPPHTSPYPAEHPPSQQQPQSELLNPNQNSHGPAPAVSHSVAQVAPHIPNAAQHERSTMDKGILGASALQTIVVQLQQTLHSRSQFRQPDVKKIENRNFPDTQESSLESQFPPPSVEKERPHASQPLAMNFHAAAMEHMDATGYAIGGHLATQSGVEFRSKEMMRTVTQKEFGENYGIPREQLDGRGGKVETMEEKTQEFYHIPQRPLPDATAIDTDDHFGRKADVPPRSNEEHAAHYQVPRKPLSEGKKSEETIEEINPVDYRIPRKPLPDAKGNNQASAVGTSSERRHRLPGMAYPVEDRSPSREAKPAGNRFSRIARKPLRVSHPEQKSSQIANSGRGGADSQTGKRKRITRRDEVGTNLISLSNSQLPPSKRRSPNKRVTGQKSILLSSANPARRDRVSSPDAITPGYPARSSAQDSRSPLKEGAGKRASDSDDVDVPIGGLRMPEKTTANDSLRRGGRRNRVLPKRYQENAFHDVESSRRLNPKKKEVKKVSATTKKPRKGKPVEEKGIDLTKRKPGSSEREKPDPVKTERKKTIHRPQMSKKVTNNTGAFLSLSDSESELELSPSFSQPLGAENTASTPLKAKDESMQDRANSDDKDLDLSPSFALPFGPGSKSLKGKGRIRRDKRFAGSSDDEDLELSPSFGQQLSQEDLASKPSRTGTRSRNDAILRALSDDEAFEHSGAQSVCKEETGTTVDSDASLGSRLRRRSRKRKRAGNLGEDLQEEGDGSDSDFEPTSADKREKSRRGGKSKTPEKRRRKNPGRASASQTKNAGRDAVTQDSSEDAVTKNDKSEGSQEFPSQESGSQPLSLKITGIRIKRRKKKKSQQVIPEVHFKRLSELELEHARIAFYEHYPRPPSNWQAQGRYQQVYGRDMPEKEQHELWKKKLKPWTDRWWELYSDFVRVVREAKLAKPRDKEPVVTMAQVSRLAAKFHKEVGCARDEDEGEPCAGCESANRTRRLAQDQRKARKAEKKEEQSSDADLHEEDSEAERADALEADMEE